MVFSIIKWSLNFFFYVGFRNDSFFEIQLDFRQTRFTDKIQTRAYTIDDLIGTCGGYIGLFLGYALVQFPQLIEFTFQTLKQKILAGKVHQIKPKANMEDVRQFGAGEDKDSENENSAESNLNNDEKLTPG